MLSPHIHHYRRLIWRRRRTKPAALVISICPHDWTKFNSSLLSICKYYMNLSDNRVVFWVILHGSSKFIVSHFSIFSMVMYKYPDHRGTGFTESILLFVACSSYHRFVVISFWESVECCFTSTETVGLLRTVWEFLFRVPLYLWALEKPQMFGKVTSRDERVRGDHFIQILPGRELPVERKIFSLARYILELLLSTGH